MTSLWFSYQGQILGKKKNRTPKLEHSANIRHPSGRLQLASPSGMGAERVPSSLRGEGWYEEGVQCITCYWLGVRSAARKGKFLSEFETLTVALSQKHYLCISKTPMNQGLHNSMLNGKLGKTEKQRSQYWSSSCCKPAKGNLTWVLIRIFSRQLQTWPGS